MRVSNSKLKTFRRCEKQYDFKYVRGIRPRERKIQLEKGSWMHSLLQHYYEGKSWQARHKELTAQFYKLFEEEREMLGDLPRECLRLMKGYLRRYDADDSRRYAIVDCEMDEIITLPNGLKLQIIVDLIVEDLVEGGLWLWDHKFRATFAPGDDMLIDPQLTLYYWGLEHMGYTPLRGAMYNEVRTKVPTVPALLKSGQLSQAKSIDTDVFTYMSAIRKHGLDASDYAEILQLIAVREKDRFYRRTHLPKDPPVVRAVMREAVITARNIARAEQRGEFVRDFESSCRWGCDYRDLCIAELHGADINSLVKMNYTVKERHGE